MRMPWVYCTQGKFKQGYGVVNLGSALVDLVTAAARATAIQTAVNAELAPHCKMNVALRVGTDYVQDALPASGNKDYVNAKFTLYNIADPSKMKQYFIPGVKPSKDGDGKIDTKATVMRVYDIAQAFVDNSVHYDDATTILDGILSAGITKVKDFTKEDDLSTNRS